MGAFVIEYADKDFNPIKQNYIHAFLKHVNWNTKEGTLSSTVIKKPSYAFQIYKANAAKLFNITDATGQALNVLQDFTDDDLIQIFTEACDKINNNIPQAVANINFQFARDIVQARSHSNVFANKNINEDKFKDFMNAILDALSLISNLSAQQKEDFVKAYLAIANKIKKRKQQKNTIEREFNKNVASIVSLNQIKNGREVIENVLKYLKNILINMNEKGDRSYSKSSMSTSLNNIMGNAIGEYLNTITGGIVLQADKMVQGAFQQGEQVGSRTSAHTSRVQEGRLSTSRTDNIFKNANLQIDTTLSNSGPSSYTIIGQLNTSVKWYQDQVFPEIQGKISKNPISITKSYIMFYAKKIFSEQLYGVYNTLAFNNDYKLGKNKQGEVATNYRIIRSGIISNFLDLLLAGKGTALSGSKDLFDLSSFLVIGGKYYSIFSILYAYSQNMIGRDSLAYGSRENKNDLFFLSPSFSGEKPQFQQKKEGETSLDAALRRSDLVSKYVDRVGFELNMRPDKLEYLLKAMRIQPLNT